jgi:large subunit ribosomal protein L5
MKIKPIKKIEKVVINSGIGKFLDKPHFSDKVLPELMGEFARITGQKPASRTARTSIAGFKIREGMTVGLITTLRGKRMEDFLERLIKIVIPRIKDFRGIPLTHVDKNGNLTIGIKECIVFPEINPETLSSNFTLQITVVPKHIKDREKMITVYRELQIPFKKS